MNRLQRIRQLIDEVKRRRAAGEMLSDAMVARQYSELLPELDEELSKLQPSNEPRSRTEQQRPSTARSGKRGESTVDFYAQDRADDSTAARPRTTLGDFELLETIAEGGMGVVYKARQKSLNRVVALKMIRSRQLATDEDVRRFYVEAEAVAQLDHPHIVPLYEVGEHEGQHYFAMAYVDGRSLAEELRDSPLAPRAAADYVRVVSEAIHYAHQRGVLHRDIKPGNVLIDNTGLLRVTDFGLAKRIGNESGLTRDSQVLGTPEYMPPEQARAEHDRMGPVSDVYSLGALLYALITGRPPFRADNWMATLVQVTEVEPASVRLLNSAIDRDLETICHKCLEKEPSRRYASAQELAEELNRFLRREPILARPLGRAARLVRWCKRQPVVAGLSASSVLLLAAVAVVATVAYLRQRELSATLAESLRSEAAAHEKTEQQMSIAKAAREEERTARRLADRRRYIAEMNLVKIAWADADLPRMIRLLERQHPRPGEADQRGFEWFYFWRLCQVADAGISVPHSVAAITYAPDGTSCVLVGRTFDDDQGRVTRMDLPSRELHAMLNGDDVEYRCAAYSSSGDLLAVAGEMKNRDENLQPEDAVSRIDVVNAGTGQQLYHLSVAGSVQRLGFVPDSPVLAIGLDVSDQFGEVLLWDVETKDTRKAFDDYVNHVLDLAVSADGATLAVASSNATATVWDLETGQERHALLNHEGSVQAIAYSPQRPLLATGGSDRTVRLWDLEDGRQIGLLHGHSGTVTSVAFSPDGARLASGSADRTVRVWDVRSQSLASTLKGHHHKIEDVAFSTDGEELFSVENDWSTHVCNVKSWHISELTSGEAFPAHDNGVTQLAFLPGTAYIATRSGVGHVWLRDPVTGEVVTVFSSSLKAVSSFAFSPDGQTIAVAEMPPRRLFADDGTFLFTSLSPAAIKLWSVYGKSKPVTLREYPQAEMTQLKFSPDGKRLAIGTSVDGKVGQVDVWNVEQQRTEGTIQGLLGLVKEMSFTPNGRFLAVASGIASSDSNSEQSVGELSIWDVANRTREWTLQQGAGWATNLTISPTGDLLAAVIENIDDMFHAPRAAKTFINLWDLKTGRLVKTLTPPAGYVDAMRFDLSGATLILTGQDFFASGNRKEILFVDVSTGDEIVRLTGGMSRLALSDDGALLALGGHGLNGRGAVHVLKSALRSANTIPADSATPVDHRPDQALFNGALPTREDPPE